MAKYKYLSLAVATLSIMNLNSSALAMSPLNSDEGKKLEQSSKNEVSENCTCRDQLFFASNLQRFTENWIEAYDVNRIHVLGRAACLKLQETSSAVAVAPDVSAGYRHRSELYRQGNRFDLALEDANKAVEVAEKYENKDNKQLPLCLYQRCTVLLEADKGDWERALQDASAAVALAPQASVGYRLRSKIYVCKKYFDLALDQANKAVEVAEKYESQSFQELAYSLCQRSAVYLKLNKVDQAVADSEKVFSHYANLRPALTGFNEYDTTPLEAKRARFYLQKKEYQKVLDVVGEFSKLYPNSKSPEILICQALANVGLGKAADGLAILNDAILKYPFIPQVYEERGRFFKSQGNSDLATKDFERAKELSHPSGIFSYQIP